MIFAENGIVFFKPGVGNFFSRRVALIAELAKGHCSCKCPKKKSHLLALSYYRTWTRWPPPKKGCHPLNGCVCKLTNAFFIVACEVFGSLIQQLFPLFSSSLRFTEVSKVLAGRTKCSQGSHVARRP